MGFVMGAAAPTPPLMLFYDHINTIPTQTEYFADNFSSKTLNHKVCTGNDGE